ncbi:glycoside hydrolase family 27 protein [Parafilimonas sp.]|uniref:glycoside hydrolase family 27 protein n=1 Tax=Parafilimonas sp. TaxID=1969739 RepID=UPI0039E30691
MKKIITTALLFCFSFSLIAQKTVAVKRQTPLMGWSSWNNFHVNISEQLIKAQADAMVASGMKDAGYSFINIDDGFWGGRDEKGYIKPHPTRFPGGMKQLAAYIHSKGLKAGIYSDAGLNTCASMWDKDTIGSGMGLYGHEYQDLHQMLVDWDYDFIKVDWCGGQAMGLDEEVSYTRISKIIKQLRPGAIFNVCRWQFPGKWVCGVADSWRISGDIDNTFESILKIIDLNAGLWRYAGPGHVNDMDMLQVGRGMTYEEDKTHFSMWCMLASPLLAGNDLTTMSKETISILTNKEMIAINQDPLVYQARKIMGYGEQEVWARPLMHTMSGKVAVALLNRSAAAANIPFNVDSVGLKAAKGYTIHDVWAHTSSGRQTQPQQNFKVPPHGIVVLVITGESSPFNIFQKE